MGIAGWADRSAQGDDRAVGAEGVEPAGGMWPSEHLPDRVRAARERFADLLEHQIANA